jgi:hypothetical protein
VASRPSFAFLNASPVPDRDQEPQLLASFRGSGDQEAPVDWARRTRLLARMDHRSLPRSVASAADVPSTRQRPDSLPVRAHGLRVAVESSSLHDGALASLVASTPQAACVSSSSARRTRRNPDERAGARVDSMRRIRPPFALRTEDRAGPRRGRSRDREHARRPVASTSGSL